MASEVKILLTATDNASKVIKQTTSGLGGMKSGLDGTLKSLTGFGLSTFTALGAVTALAGGIKKVVNETVEYGKQVDDLSRALGTSTEEASKLIQIADDLRIDVGSLQTAFRIALKQGILPSVDGLKDLGAEYKALKTPAEKAQFALKTFGRSGLQMQKILELDAKALDEMAKSAEEAGLVMSRDSVEATKAYWKELDNLSDRFTGLKINIGTHVIPALTGMIGALDEVAFKADWSGKAIDQQFNQALSNIPEVSGRAGTGVQDVAKAVDDLDIELGDSSSHWLPAFDASARTAAGWVDELGAEIGETTQETDRLSESMRAFSAELIFNKASANLDADAALKLGLALDVVDSKSLLAMEALENLRQRYDTNADGAIDATEAARGYALAVQRLFEQIDKLPDYKKIEIEIDVYGDQIPGTGGGGKGGGAVPKQLGGPVSAGQPYIVGERGWEPFFPAVNGRVLSHADAMRAISNTTNTTNRGGDNYNININNYNAAAAAMSIAQIQRIRRQRLNRFMGA